MQNLFHSVQLNVNNPHFLIMQGRITKVRRAGSMGSAGKGREGIRGLTTRRGRFRC